MAIGHARSRIVLGGALLWLLAGPARAQDTRTVSEPRLPPACATLAAKLAARQGALAPAYERRPDTRRIQEAIDACPAVTLAAAGAKNVFLAGPLHLKAGVTLVMGAGAALYASRNPRDYDVSPGSC